MRFWYELYDGQDKVVEEGEIQFATGREAEDWADVRLSEVLPNEEFATFGVFEWPEGDA